ncbi:hypothetical protein N7471_003841 [Penicillium samsonianum]|uniref:uncharacterized protein n=1 Tax=Penicillium samsonianum TaxID=1882272 RepID=UPI0025476CFB|nr:uncharacterized protein N7471_003841 [Penicillium samsonianum]KAJ6137355.1 hypothetical protein N7471_003841 [Penicillium samsonianum]
MARGAGATGAGRGGRGGRGGGVRAETRTCHYCLQVGHLQADCHLRQLVETCRANGTLGIGFVPPPRRRAPRRRPAAATNMAPAASDVAPGASNVAAPAVPDPAPAPPTTNTPPAPAASGATNASSGSAAASSAAAGPSSAAAPLSASRPARAQFLTEPVRAPSRRHQFCYHTISRFVWALYVAHTWSMKDNRPSSDRLRSACGSHMVHGGWLFFVGSSVFCVQLTYDPPGYRHTE